MKEKSVFNPHDALDLSREMTQAILRRWSIPSIEFLNENENYGEGFIVNSFGAKYTVRIETEKK